MTQIRAVEKAMNGKCCQTILLSPDSPDIGSHPEQAMGTAPITVTISKKLFHVVKECISSQAKFSILTEMRNHFHFHFLKLSLFISHEKRK